MTILELILKVFLLKSKFFEEKALLLRYTYFPISSLDFLNAKNNNFQQKSQINIALILNNHFLFRLPITKLLIKHLLLYILDLALIHSFSLLFPYAFTESFIVSLDSRRFIVFIKHHPHIIPQCTRTTKNHLHLIGDNRLDPVIFELILVVVGSPPVHVHLHNLAFW